MPDRHGPMRSGLGWFVVEANGGDIGDGGVVVSTGEAGVESTLPYLSNEPEADPESTSLVVPVGTRAGGEIDSDSTALNVAGWELDAEEVTLTERSWIVSPGEIYTQGLWVPEDSSGEASDPIDRGWWPKEYTPDQSVSDRMDGGQVVVPLGEQEPSDLFGEFDDEVPGETVDAGESVETESTAFLDVGTQFVEIDDVESPEVIFDAGAAIPMNGSGFGMGVLSTPSATVAGQDANPIIQVSSEDLLTRDETANLLSNAGISDAESIEWAAGPESVEAESEYEPPELLGEETEIELFTGVVSGSEAPWGVTLGIARGTPDDHVIAIGLSRRAVGTGDGGLEAVQSDQHVIDNMAEMLAETVPSLSAE